MADLRCQLFEDLILAAQMRPNLPQVILEVIQVDIDREESI